MNKKLSLVILLILAFQTSRSQRTWQQLTFPAYAEMRSNFKNYPVEYSESLTWGWDGVATRETICHDLDAIKKQGLNIVTIECGYRMGVEYLTDGWFKKVKLAVEEAKKRNMRLWIIDEGKYPSGFAGGKFSREKPELRMQGIDIAERIMVAEGEIISRKLDPLVISAVAVDQKNKKTVAIDIASGKLRWQAPMGSWQILLARHHFKTSVTRAANNVTGGKDTVNSLCDYLDPAATKQFLEFTEAQYKKYIGNEFGKTVLGFRGDEPEFNFTPWTPKIISIFKEKKGYDITPYLATFFTPFTNEEQKLAKADYWDVWSDLFRDNFFKVQADWCAANNMEYMVHLDHEDKLVDLARTEGDYFKDMRFVHIPGVDAIWNQVWYNKIADFPKIASSAAHLYGRPRALSETFAAYNPKPTVQDAKWVIDYEMVRGINVFEYMFWPASSSGRSGPSGYLSDSSFPAVAQYSNRASYLLSSGRPMAQIGVYMPTESMWLNNESSNTGLLNISKQLLENQLDFDIVDAQGIGSLFTLEKGKFKNLSKQDYSTIILPPLSVLKEDVMTKLRSFANSGGSVFFSETNFSIAGKTFIAAKISENFTWGYKVTGDSLPVSLLRKLSSDIVLEDAHPSVKYLHRKWKDADLYFLFNEGNETIKTSASVNGKGEVEVWDALKATITALPHKRLKPGKVNFTLELAPHETKFIVIKN